MNMLQTALLYCAVKKYPYDKRVDELLTMFMEKADNVLADEDCGNELGVWYLNVHMDGAWYELMMDDSYHDDMTHCRIVDSIDTIYSKVRPSRRKEAEFRDWLGSLHVAPPTKAPWLPKLDKLLNSSAIC